MRGTKVQLEADASKNEALCVEIKVHLHRR